MSLTKYILMTYGLGTFGFLKKRFADNGDGSLGLL